MAPGEHERTVLRDGIPAAIRPIKPDGAEALVIAIRRLTPRSRYQRFLSARADYSTAEMDPFVKCDGIERIGIVLAPLDESGEELPPVGVAHCLRDARHSVSAEVAVVVTDEWQGRGVGSALIASLARRAAAVGIERWWALMLTDNFAARRLLEKSGRVRREVVSSGLSELTFDLAPGVG